MVEIDKRRFRAALALAGTTQSAFAVRLGVSPATLSNWVRGVATPPSNWRLRIERLLGVPAGSLRPSPAQGERANRNPAEAQEALSRRGMP